MLLGWIKLHRQLLDNWVMTEPEALSVWVRFLLEANHEDKKKVLNGSLVEIKRGQLIFGLEAFSSRSGVSIAKLRRYLKLFESEGMISRLKTVKYSIITIASFESHQSGDSQIANQSQTNRKPIATPKECKNEKNDKKYTEDGFNYWWKTYPSERRTNKKGCLTKWLGVCKKLNDDEVEDLVNEIVTDLQKRIKETEEIKYFPQTTTYINQEKWKDGQ